MLQPVRSSLAQGFLNTVLGGDDTVCIIIIMILFEVIIVTNFDVLNALIQPKIKSSILPRKGGNEFMLFMDPLNHFVDENNTVE